jgi:hypothetical protein
VGLKKMGVSYFPKFKLYLACNDKLFYTQKNSGGINELAPIIRSILAERLNVREDFQVHSLQKVG